MKIFKIKEHEIMIDDDDAYLFEKYKWYVDVRPTTKYVFMVVYKNGKSTSIYLHRHIMKAQRGLEVDHIDCNSLNNTKDNLRICKRIENACNRRPQGGTSKYKGVYLNKRSNKWQCQISKNSNTIYLGRYENEIDAAKEYDKAALELYGEYARLNFKEEKICL